MMTIGKQIDQKAAKSMYSKRLAPDTNRMNAAQNTPALAMQRAAIAPELLSAEEMQRIQSAFGNQALEQMLAGNQNHAPRSSENRTGMPEQLKTSLENQSGISMDKVRVHFNSPKPFEIDALAYTQGTEIHIAPGQERHLPHEAWHVVQQMQGRVAPTMQVNQTAINDEQGLESEADRMGEKLARPASLQPQLPEPAQGNQDRLGTGGAVQRFSFLNWLKSVGMSGGNLLLGLPFRMGKRSLEFLKHLTIDLVKAIYRAVKGYHVQLEPEQSGLMAEKSPLITWLFGLFTKAADIFNIREIMGFLAVLLGTPWSDIRGLSDEEKALARRIFGDSINLYDVRIFENSLLSRLVTWSQDGAFTTFHTIHRGVSFDDKTPESRAILMHELMHIAQEQKQGMLGWIELEWGRLVTKAAHPGKPDPEYWYGEIKAGYRFRDYSKEQQGAIIEDYAIFIQTCAIKNQVPAPGDMVLSSNGQGEYQYYQQMLAGLQKGHWALPWQNSEWKETIG